MGNKYENEKYDHEYIASTRKIIFISYLFGNYRFIIYNLNRSGLFVTRCKIKINTSSLKLT